MNTPGNWLNRWTAQARQFLIPAAWPLCAWLCVAGPGPAGAHPFIPDQVNDGFTSGGFVVFPGRVLGQQFVPAMGSLEAVELTTNDQRPGNGQGTDLFVRIRSGTVAGPILGTSATVSLPDGRDASESVVHFDFPAVVPLTPGALHVIEIVAASGDNRGISGTGWGVNAYAAGSVIVDGAVYADPLSSPFDLWFREGPTCAPSVDQANEGVVTGGFVVPLGSPVGQEFVPATASLDYVELKTNDQQPGNGHGTDLNVRIRAGSIAGPILGTSATISVPDSSDAAISVAHFDFPSAVVVVPGAVHVIEVVSAAGDPRGIWASGGPHDDYPAGGVIFRGAIYNEPAVGPFDLWFREGLRCSTSLPDPASRRLSIGRSGTHLVISWTTTDPTLVLQMTTDLHAGSWTPVPAEWITADGIRFTATIPDDPSAPMRFFRLAYLCPDAYRCHVHHYKQTYGKSAAWEQWMLDNRSRYETVFTHASAAPAVINLAFRYDTTPIAYHPPWTDEAQHMTALKTLAEASYPGYHFVFQFGGDPVASYANVIAGIPSNASHASGKEVYVYYETIFAHEFGHIMGVQHHYDTLPQIGAGNHFPPGEVGCLMDRNSNQYCSACRTALRIPLDANTDAAIGAAVSDIFHRYPY